MEHKSFIIQQNEIRAASKIFFFYTALQTIHSSQVVKGPLGSCLQNSMLDQLRGCFRYQHGHILRTSGKEMKFEQA